MKYVSEHLTILNDYPIEKEIFTDIFESINDKLWNTGLPFSSSNFMCFWKSDTMYMLHLDSGTMISYYKHVGRGYNCNKPLSVEEFRMFADMLMRELQGETIDPDDIAPPDAPVHIHTKTGETLGTKR